MSTDGDGLTWPLWTIDFEASALDKGSYPVEVGLALWPSREALIQSWSTVIAPTSEWRERGRWSAASAAFHGLGREDLAAGSPPPQVAAALNAVLGVGVVYCDGGDYDDYWMRRLFEAGGISPTFRLGDWRMLMDSLGETGLRALDLRRTLQTSHRAREDAEGLLVTLAKAAGVVSALTGDPDGRVPPRDNMR